MTLLPSTALEAAVSMRQGTSGWRCPRKPLRRRCTAELPARSRRYNAAPRTGAHRVEESRSGRSLLKANTRIQAKHASTRSNTNLLLHTELNWKELDEELSPILCSSRREGGGDLRRGDGACHPCTTPPLHSGHRTARNEPGVGIGSTPLYQVSMVAWQPYLFSLSLWHLAPLVLLLYLQNFEFL